MLISAQNVQLQNVTYMQLIDRQESSEQVSKLASFPGSPCVQTKKRQKPGQGLGTSLPQSYITLMHLR